jgi:putative hydrolase of HD superfamily
MTLYFDRRMHRLTVISVVDSSSVTGIDIVLLLLLKSFNFNSNQSTRIIITITIFSLLLLGLVGTASSSFYCPPTLHQRQHRPPNPLYRTIIMNTLSTTIHDNNDNDTNNVSNIIDFMTIARGLKTTQRTGWVLQEAGPKIESVADHSWRITLMTTIAASASASTSTPSTVPSSVDPIKCIKMALVHDLAEATVGDITPHCGISDEDKHTRELIAMTELTNKLGRMMPTTTTTTPTTEDDGSSSERNHKMTALTSSTLTNIGQELLDLWMEYESGTTEEAKLVKDMDKLEMTLQALEYEQDGKNQKSLDGFFDSTRGKWRTSIGEAWGNEIESRRTKKEGGTTPTTNNEQT